MTQNWKNEQENREHVEKRLANLEVVLRSTTAKLKFEAAECIGLKEKVSQLEEKYAGEAGARKTLQRPSISAKVQRKICRQGFALQTK